MSQEKYVEHFVDIMTKSLQESMVKNISLQANLKITESIIKELQESGNNTVKDLQAKVNELTGVVDSTQKELELVRTSRSSNENSKIQQLQNTINENNNTINNLRKQINDLSIVKTEYESVKHQVSHIDTFRNELSKTREELQSVHGKYGSEIASLKQENEKVIRELSGKYGSEIGTLKQQYENSIKELNDQIDYLKLTPAKRKKIDEAKSGIMIDTSTNLDQLISNEITKDGGSF